MGGSNAPRAFSGKFDLLVNGRARSGGFLFVF